MRLFILFTVLFSTGLPLVAQAMEFEPVKVMVYKRGEAIFGEEFLAANEAVVDYLATLRRPTEAYKAIRYQCQVKGRYIRPSVQPYNTAQNSTYVPILMIYSMSDCNEIP